MGATNTKRYIKTSGLMKTPTATKTITANGDGQDVLNYAKVNVAVPSHVLAYAYAQTVHSQFTTAYSSNSNYLVAEDNSVQRSITTKVAGRFWSNKTGEVIMQANQVLCSADGRDSSSNIWTYTLIAVYLGPI